jgi:hypothetical protein
VCTKGFEVLLFLVYSLDCAAAFMEFSKEAILEQVGSFDTYKILNGFHMVPESLLRMNLFSVDNIVLLS